MNERDRVLARIDEIEQILRNIQSDDVRRTLRQALADCEQQLVELDARWGAPATPTPSSS